MSWETSEIFKSSSVITRAMRKLVDKFWLVSLASNRTGSLMQLLWLSLKITTEHWRCLSLSKRLFKMTKTAKNWRKRRRLSCSCWKLEYMSRWAIIKRLSIHWLTPRQSLQTKLRKMNSLLDYIWVWVIKTRQLIIMSKKLFLFKYL